SRKAQAFFTISTTSGLFGPSARAGETRPNAAKAQSAIDDKATRRWRSAFIVRRVRNRRRGEKFCEGESAAVFLHLRVPPAPPGAPAPRTDRERPRNGVLPPRERFDVD